jgi:hypothetical protein
MRSGVGWRKMFFFEGWVTKKFGQENVSPQCPPPAINNDRSLNESHMGPVPEYRKRAKRLGGVAAGTFKILSQRRIEKATTT